MENRTEGRANVFLTASLDAGGASTPVRIRNISARGALIEGRSLPPEGAAVRLVRGSLSVQGRLAWQQNGLAGLNFDTEIDVDTWVQRVGHSGQQRVDRLVGAIRRSGELPREMEDVAPVESLGTLSTALDDICKCLAEMPNMSVEFGEQLLRLDAIAQALRRAARRGRS